MTALNVKEVKEFSVIIEYILRKKATTLGTIE
jgi:hypothetical protein